MLLNEIEIGKKIDVKVVIFILFNDKEIIFYLRVLFGLVSEKEI